MLEIYGGDMLFTEAAKQGLWAVLYITLFIYVLRESKHREDRLRGDYDKLRNESSEREDKLTSFISDISEQYERLATGVEKLTDDVYEIKDELKLCREKEESIK